MEFLMTYGWAILVVLIAIGALAYFGVLNPSRFLPASCTLMPGLSCDSFKVESGANQVTLVVRNGLGDDLTDVSFATCNATSTPAPLNDGDTATHTITVCTPALGSAGTRFKQDLTVSYTQDGLTHTRTGQLVTEIEP